MGYSERIEVVINKEIEHDKKAYIPNRGEEFKEGYILGLQQALYLVKQMEKADKDAPLETLEDTLIMVENNLEEYEALQIIQILVNKYGKEILDGLV